MKLDIQRLAFEIVSGGVDVSKFDKIINKVNESKEIVKKLELMISGVVFNIVVDQIRVSEKGEVYVKIVHDKVSKDKVDSRLLEQVSRLVRGAAWLPSIGQISFFVK